MATHAEIATLIDQLENYQTRARAHRSLQELGTEPAEQLMSVLNNPDAPVNQKWAAIDLLRVCRYVPAVPKLVDLLSNESNLIGEVADALRNITGKDLGDSAEEWQDAIAGVTHEELQNGSFFALETDEDKLSFVKEAVGEEAQDCSWEKEGYVHLRVPLGQRHQQVLVLFEDQEEGEPVVTLYSESGLATPQAQHTVDIQNLTLKTGAFAIEENADDEGVVVMRDTIEPGSLTGDILRDRVMDVARAADSLEKELHGHDKI